jgi:hypothetical protein
LKRLVDAVINERKIVFLKEHAEGVLIPRAESRPLEPDPVNAGGGIGRLNLPRCPRAFFV